MKRQIHVYTFLDLFYHEHEQQQHQQRQHGLCDWGRFSGCPPIVDVPPCVAAALLLLPPPPLPCDEPRSRILDRCNSVTLHDIVCKADPILVQHFRWSRWTTLTLCSTKIEAFSRQTLTFDRMMEMDEHKNAREPIIKPKTKQTIFQFFYFNIWFDWIFVVVVAVVVWRIDAIGSKCYL